MTSIKRFFYKQNLKLHFLVIFLVYFSFFFFRGRIGGDDLQSFNVALNFFYSDLSFFEFFLIEKENLFVLMHRKVWLLQDFLIIKFLSFFNIFFNFNLIFWSKYFAGFIITFYTVLSFYLLIILIKKTKTDYYDFYTTFFIVFSIFFGSGLVSFFSGQYIESLAFLLFLLKCKYKNYSKNFFIDIILINIKPYYLIIILGFEISRRINLIKFYSFKNFFPFIYISILTFVFFLPNLFLGEQFTKLQMSTNMNYNLDFIIFNLFLFFFSPGQGIIFTWTVLLIIVLLGYDKKSTLIKIFFASIFIIFLCTFAHWNGFSPGNRYLLSILPIFIEEIKNCKNYFMFSKEKPNLKKLLLYLLSILTFLNLPTIEDRNTSLHEYERNSAFKFLDKNYVNPDIDDADIFFLPLDKIDFHNSIFSTKVLINKIIKKENFKIAGRDVNLNAIYPMTSIARLIYIQKNDLAYVSDDFLKKIDKFSEILIAIYLITLFSIIFSYLFSINSIIKKN